MVCVAETAATAERRRTKDCILDMFFFVRLSGEFLFKKERLVQRKIKDRRE